MRLGSWESRGNRSLVLTVSVAQDGRTWQLASGIDAVGDHYGFHVPLVLPNDLTPGQATVRVDGYGAAAPLRIQRGD